MRLILICLLFLAGQNLSAQVCNNWLKNPSLGSSVKVGDLDITGNQITVEATFNRTDPWTGSYVYAGDLVSKHLNPTNVNYLLRPNSAEITNTNGTYFVTPPICDIQLNKTYHAAMVYDGVTLKFYRNGFLMSSVPASGNLYQNDFITSIGEISQDNSLNTTFKGFINEVRIWNVARTQTQIRTYMNTSLPLPTTQVGLKAYYTFNNLLNKQGNTAWNGTLVGSATINATNTSCNFVADSCNINVALPVTASFTAPATVCVNTPVQVTNTTQNATNYYWSFCETNFQATPGAVNLGNVGGVLSMPVFSDLIKDQNGNYFAFVTNHVPAKVLRYNYGNSYLNTPTVSDLGDFGGVLVSHPEGIKVVKAGNNYVAVVVGGNPQVGDQSKVTVINFGTNINNNAPVVNSYANIGGMDFPIDLSLFFADGTWHAYTVNTRNNTITKLDFGADFTATPTGTNLGNLGSLNIPTGMGEINNNGNWHIFVTNEGSHSLTRLDFGTSLNSVPTAVNIPNPGNILAKPRDISFIRTCDGVTGFIPNGTTATVIKLDFGNNILNTPTATSLGSIGNLDFPHSISNLFRVDNDIYTLITNVNNNSITRLRFEGCQTIPGSALQNPPPITYTQPGTYNINLTVDIGLPTQTSFCRKIVVDPCVVPITASFNAPATICVNTPVQVTNTTQNASNYYWSFCETNFQGTPSAVNLGNVGGVLSMPVFSDLIKDQNGNYFAFVTNHIPAKVLRYNYGNSYLNTPTVSDLGDFGGVLVSHPEGIKVVKAGNNYIAVVVGGNPQVGDQSKVTVINFGTNITNNAPVVNSYANIGGMDFPIDLSLFFANGTWHAYTVNTGNNTITKLDFGADFTATPTGTNLGNLGSLNIPTGMGEINNNGNWHIFVTNEGNHSLTRLDFGTSLNSVPTAVNIPNPNNMLAKPRDISFIRTCDGVTGFIPNGTTATVIKLDFGNNILNIPTATSLGAIGNLDFPHSISTLFRVDNDIYTLITNVNNNSITRLRFEGCQTIPGSSLQNPPPITYAQPGTYNINLTVDIGLPTQTSFCKKITVLQCAADTIINKYTPVISLDICKNILNVQDATDYHVGDTVMIIQMKGAVIDSTNTAAFGTVTDYKNAGNYEFNYIKSKTGNAIELLNIITRQYDAPKGKVQLIRVPYYKSSAFTNRLTCLPWDGSKGGVLVLNVKDTVTLNADIDVSGRGFRGGKAINSRQATWIPSCGSTSYYSPSNALAMRGKGEGIAEISDARSSGRGPLANGGGGGNTSNSGGGGGSNAVLGGNGGDQFEGCTTGPNNVGGLPGKAIPFSIAAQKIYMGGGGGAGDANDPLGANSFNPDGGNGGGIAIIMADYLSAKSSVIKFNGDDGKFCPANCGEGMGGGGAAGALLLNVNNFIVNSSNIAFTIFGMGGKGADNTVGTANTNHGPGGGGSGGVFAMNSTLPPGMLAVGVASGGISGMCQNTPPTPWGATAGNPGLSFFNLTLPIATIPFKQNIDSVRFTPVNTGCRKFDFNAIAYTNISAPVSWQWTFGDGATANTQNTSHTYATANTFPVKLVITDINGCKDSVVKNILTSTLAVDAGLDTAYCSNESVTRTLHATGTGPWTWTPAQYLDNPAAQHPVATVASTTKFYVSIADAFGCTAVDSITITVKSLPNVRTLPDSSICKGSPLVLTTTGAGNYTWSPAAYVSNAGSPNPSFIHANSQTLYVSGTGANGCIGKDTINITVNPLPLVRTLPDSLICGNQNIVLTTTGAQNYTWSPAGGLDNASSPSPVFSGTHGAGQYIVSGMDANRCVAKDTINISVRSRTAIVAPPAKEMCFNKSVILDGNNGNNVLYNWSPAATLSNTTIINPVATPAATQVYVLKMTDKVCRYDSTFNVTVTVNPLPLLAASKSNDISCNLSSAKLTATGAASYSWTPAATLSGATTATPVAAPSVTTLYTVTGTSAKGCINTDTLRVFVSTATGGFGIPNTFTPNGDRTNECFGIKHWGIVKNLVFIIFDRWGNKVFETNNPAVCWNGKYKGQNADQGSYSYFIKGTVGCGEMIRKGNVLLIR